MIPCKQRQAPTPINDRDQESSEDIEKNNIYIQ